MNRRRAFTLLEILAAAAIFALLLAALYSVFFGALRLREGDYDRFESGYPRDRVAAILRADLAAALTPGGIMAGDFIGETDTDRDDEAHRLEFYSSAGDLNDEDPWGDVQKVEYYLLENEDQVDEDLDDTSSRDKPSDFVRAVTRNLLASTEEDPEETRLLRNVSAFAAEYYDGTDWTDAWDSSASDGELPRAVRLLVTFADDADSFYSEPFEIVVETACKPLEAVESQSSSSQPPEDGGGGGRP